MNDDNYLIKRRVSIIFLISFFFFLIIVFKVGYLQLFNTKASLKELENISVTTAYGLSNPRGKIYDRNMNVIVDNIGIYMINYKKKSGITTSDEIKIAYELANNIMVDYENLNTRNLKEFWLVNNYDKAKNKITKSEYEAYERRKLSEREIEELKIQRVTEDEINSYHDIDRKAAYIYYLMNNGYSYDDKIIKEEASSDEYNYILQNKDVLTGVNVVTSWKRTYPYGDVLRQILGSVSTSKQGIPKEKKATYLNKGYSLNDRVGLSYLEEEYEDYLRGTKDKYEIRNGKRKLVSKGKKGNDLVLSIDINLQLKLEEVIKEELLSAVKEPNTNYFNHATVVITNPKTGEILALSSKQIIKNQEEYKISDYTTSILTESNTPGSIVKGASMLVGYKTGVLKIGDVLYDKCIKFKNTPEKCSWSKSLGALNDIKALELSSNSYQFQLALKVAGVNYYYDMPISINEDAINNYRSIFNGVGLGVKSGIDLPYETEGVKGKSNNAGLLLNYAIGQYDTYSVLQLSSYINTIINNGERLKLNLVSKIIDNNGNNVMEYKKVVLNKMDIDEVYFNRVKEGFKSVMEGYLGRGYMGDINNPAGKTGTSESFFDADNDNIVDTETYTKSFVGYAPYDDPVMSIVSISPHVSYKNGNNSYTSNVNKRITSRICNIFFEIYK